MGERRAVRKLFETIGRLWDKYERVRLIAKDTAAAGVFFVEASEAEDAITLIGMCSDHLEDYEPPEAEESCPGCGAAPRTSCATDCPGDE